MAPFSSKNKLERFVCEEISDEDIQEIQNRFIIEREQKIIKEIGPNDVVGLERYLKKSAYKENKEHLTKIYLIKDKKTKLIAGYFGLKAGVVSENDNFTDIKRKNKTIKNRKNTELQGYVPLKNAIPGIELSHFAINDLFRKKLEEKTRNEIHGLGKLFFPIFIYPIIINVYKQIGVKIFYLYAADNSRNGKLVNYYREVMGLEAFENSEVSKSDVKPVRSDYDNNCIFMYRAIND